MIFFSRPLITTAFWNNELSDQRLPFSYLQCSYSLTLIRQDVLRFWANLSLDALIVIDLIKNVYSCSLAEHVLKIFLIWERMPPYRVFMLLRFFCKKSDYFVQGLVFFTLSLKLATNIHNIYLNPFSFTQ